MINNSPKFQTNSLFQINLAAMFDFLMKILLPVVSRYIYRGPFRGYANKNAVEICNHIFAYTFFYRYKNNFYTIFYLLTQKFKLENVRNRFFNWTFPYQNIASKCHLKKNLLGPLRLKFIHTFVFHI